MLDAPTGRASIYLSKYLQDNLTDLNKLITAKGFISFNSYNNQLLYDDLTTNFARIMNQKNIDPNKRIDIYNETKTIWKEKYKNNTDGEMLDLYHLLTDVRNSTIKDLKRRGVKL